MEMECIQRRALRIYSSQLDSYIEALKQAKLETLHDRRNMLRVKLFSSIEANGDQYKLKELLPPKNPPTNHLRTIRKYNLPMMHVHEQV